MVRAMKFKPDLEITAEPYQRILHEIKKRKKQLLITMLFKKDAPATFKSVNVPSHAVYRQLRRTIRHLRNK
ncbi:hypothetical protein T06_14189 [Trichinella sp. T6]|nr:hypothetical protein T06_14189 [Trichinella sp. T6]